MFSIDLLKGRGRPQKGSPKRILAKIVAVLIPIMAVGAWAVSYQQDCILAETQQAAVQDNRDVIEASAKNMKVYQQINSQIAEAKRCMNDLTGGLCYRVQVSDWLVEFAQQLPETIFIYEAELDRQPQLEKVKDAKTDAMIQRLVIERDLKVVLCGFDAEGNDQLVREYVDQLKSSETLAQTFVDFTMTAQQQGTVDGRSATYYEIECILREQR